MHTVFFPFIAPPPNSALSTFPLHFLLWVPVLKRLPANQYLWCKSTKQHCNNNYWQSKRLVALSRIKCCTKGPVVATFELQIISIQQKYLAEEHFFLESRIFHTFFREARLIDKSIFNSYHKTLSSTLISTAFLHFVSHLGALNRNKILGAASRIEVLMGVAISKFQR